MKISKKAAVILLSAVLGGVAFAGVSGSSIAKKHSLIQTSGIKIYQLKFSSIKNAIDTSLSTVSVSSEDNNSIQFDYSNLADFGDGVATFNEGASFYNPDTGVGYNNAISGLQSIKVVYEGEGDLSISYGWSIGSGYEFKNQKLTNNTLFNFDNLLPKYFKIENHGEIAIDVTSIDVSYSCYADSPESPAYTITADYDNGTIISVSTDGSGNYSLPIPSREGYNFAGWIDENEDPFNASGTIVANRAVKATWTLDGTDTLDKLVRRAAAGVEIINITADFEITQTVQVYGDVTVACSSDHTLTRKTNFDGRLFNLNSNSSITFGHPDYAGLLTLDGNKDSGAKCDAGGGGVVYSSDETETINVYNANIINHSITDKNGAVFYTDGGTINIYGGLFKDNDSVHGTSEGGLYGGVIYSKSEAFVNIVASNENTITFDGNTAYDGGGAISVNGTTTLVVNGATFISNSTSSSNGYGGAIYCAGGASSTITNSSFESNISTNKGGAIYVSSGGEIGITDTVFETNSAKSGGAICLNGNNVASFSGTTFDGNTASAGGGAIYILSGGNITISNETSFISNTMTKSDAAAYGGAIYSSGSSLTIVGTNLEPILFDGNISSYHAGAIYLVSSTAEIENVKFVNNQTTHNSGNGGVVFIASSTCTFTSCIFGENGKGNSAVNNGGVLYSGSSSTITIENCTASYNSANIGGFASLNGTSLSVTIKNLTATNNSAKSAAKGHFIAVRSTGTTVYTDETQITTDLSPASWTDVFKGYKSISETITPNIQPIPAE